MSRDRRDPAIAEIIRRLNAPGVRDPVIVADHRDGHPVSTLAAGHARTAAPIARGAAHGQTTASQGGYFAPGAADGPC